MASSLAPDSLGPTICIGEILTEIVATTVGDGFTEVQPLVGPFPSGAPAIFIDQCARIGGSAAIVGGVGDDDFGRVCVERLRQDGVDVSALRVDPDLPTGTAFVRYRADGNRDFIFNMWTSAAGRIGWTDAVEALVHRSGHLHVMGTLLVRRDVSDLIERAAGAIKARGGTISLDPNLRKELKSEEGTAKRFAKLVEQCDLLLPSGDELDIASGVTGQTASLQRLFALGVREIAQKNGANGATVYAPDTAPITHPGFAVEEVDPTGAGDCFGGAYVACRRLGMAVEQALTYANAAGARNITVRGPMEGAGTREDLDRFISETERHR